MKILFGEVSQLQKVTARAGQSPIWTILYVWLRSLVIDLAPRTTFTSRAHHPSAQLSATAGTHRPATAGAGVSMEARHDKPQLTVEPELDNAA